MYIWTYIYLLIYTGKPWKSPLSSMIFLLKTSISPMCLTASTEGGWHLCTWAASCFFSPQLCVGFLFLILYPGSAPPPPASSARLPPPPPHMSHTITSHTHTNLTYNNFTHTNTHTQLCHIPSLTYNNFTHTNLTYNNLTHTHTHTTLSHIQ